MMRTFALLLTAPFLLVLCGGELRIPFDAGWNFTAGPEFPGAAGSFKSDPEQQHGNAPTGILAADFSGGGNYVGIDRQLPANDHSTISVDVATSSKMLGLFITDSGGQWHYFEHPLSGTEEWQTLTWNLIDPDLKSNAHGGGAKDGIIRLPIRGIRFRVSPQKDLKKFSVRFGKLILHSPEEQASLSVTPEAPGGFFMQFEPLIFHINKPVADLRYRVTNQYGRETTEGEWDQAELNLTGLAPGYYTLSLLAPGETNLLSRDFSVLANLDTLPEGCPYAIDVAAVFIPSVNGLGTREAGYRFFAELARCTGFETIRDRISWASVEAERGNIKLEDFSAYREILSEHGLKVCVTNHTAPLWARAGADAMLPNDPAAVYRFMKTLSETYGEEVIWEFWNEQDLVFFTKEPAWDFATMMKAAYLGAKAGAPGNPILPGAFCDPVESAYNRTAMENGLAAYFDIFNRHQYGPLNGYEKFVDETRTFLRRYGIGDMPIWVTETGTRAEGAGVEQQGTVREHSAAQEMLQAEFMVKSQLLLQSLGVEKTFSFVLLPYNESNGSKVWGLTRHDYSTKPALTALAVLIRRLGKARYLGELAVPETAHALLFRQPDGSQSIVFWSRSELDTDDYRDSGLVPEQTFLSHFSVPAVAEARLTDLFGTSRQIAPVNRRLSLEATRYPAYLDNLSGLSPVGETSAADRFNDRQEELEKAIVLQFRFDPSDVFQIDSFGRDALIVRNSPAQSKVKLLAWNFSEKTQKGYIESSEDGIPEFPAKIEIPPFGFHEISFSLPAAAAKLRSTLRFDGNFNGKPISPLSIPVVRADRLVPAGAKQLTRATNPASWRKNSSGQMNIGAGEGENAVRFNVVFPEGVDKWIYPELPLRLPEESLENAIAVEFELKTDQQAHTHVVMFVNGDNQPARFVSYPLLPGSWRKYTVNIPAGAEKAMLIRIGMNPPAQQASFQIRNLSIRYGEFQSGEIVP